MKKPVAFDFTLTQVCNNNCIFCPRNALKPIVTTPARMLETIRTGGCLEAVLTGGEPTTLKTLPSIAAACKKSGARKIGIVTNGRTLSDAAYLETLVSAGITSFAVSVYSHLPEIHDHLTRAKGSCAQTWKGLANAARAARGGAIETGVNLVLCAENIRAAGTTLKMLKALGADSVTLINLSGPSAAANIFNYSMIPPLLRELGRGRAAYPGRIVFRGFPLCIFPEAVSAENQDIDGAGGVSRGRLLKYAGNFRREFVKPASLCRGCRKTSYCNGLASAYFERYALSGLMK
jgi:MoaA/NifB/PqqE/SkfB family radical SAM enzyme